ncbi:MAG: relaxase/mobilization nuclease domain-containing protein [bacterium]|nr:relaxase/mobilization nuclease domain-containing protein [bacterium]
MHSTAAENPRVEKPVYHLSISLDPQERLEPEVLRGVAERTLRDLGLEHHQAVLLAHEDTEHQHVHVMVNRVNPATRKAWRAGHDYARIEWSLRQQERELTLLFLHRYSSAIACNSLSRFACTAREDGCSTPKLCVRISRARRRSGSASAGRFVAWRN